MSLETLRARMAAYTSWANTQDRAARTAPARAAADARFERQVDPDGLLSPDVRRAMADAARRAYYARLALRSAEARKKGDKAPTAATAGARTGQDRLPRRGAAGHDAV
jgi:hypothetical protein